VAAEEAASHALAHSLELEEQQQLAAAGCAADRAAEALDGAAAAALAAAEWDEDAMAAEDAIAAADAAHLEELYFEQLVSPALLAPICPYMLPINAPHCIMSAAASSSMAPMSVACMLAALQVRLCRAARARGLLPLVRAAGTLGF
jgi:hypothetical protein